MRTVYRIRSISGEIIAEHVRVDLPSGRKSMSWRVPGCDPRDGLMGLGTAALPLYGSEDIPWWPVGETVLIVEGEKSRDALATWGVPALATVTGSSSTPGEDALAVLLPFDVVLWPDHLDGDEHMARVAASVGRLGGSARRLMWAGAREKGDDAADFVARGGARVALELMIQAATPWTMIYTEPPRRTQPAYHGSDDRVETARSHLVDVVESKLGPPARRMGRSLFWRCPFHADRTPSFKVDLREPFYRCFGCDARGDVFTFLEAVEGRGFREALTELAPPQGLGAIPRWGA